MMVDGHRFPCRKVTVRLLDSELSRKLYNKDMFNYGLFFVKAKGTHVSEALNMHNCFLNMQLSLNCLIFSCKYLSTPNMK